MGSDFPTAAPRPPIPRWGGGLARKARPLSGARLPCSALPSSPAGCSGWASVLGGKPGPRIPLPSPSPLAACSPCPGRSWGRGSAARADPRSTPPGPGAAGGWGCSRGTVEVEGNPNPPPPPSRAGVLGRQGAFAGRASPRSQRRRFVCIQIPGAGGGENRGGGYDPEQSLGRNSLFWGEQVPSSCVLVPGTGELEQWKSVPVAA